MSLKVMAPFLNVPLTFMVRWRPHQLLFINVLYFGLWQLVQAAFYFWYIYFSRIRKALQESDKRTRVCIGYCAGAPPLVLEKVPSEGS